MMASEGCVRTLSLILSKWTKTKSILTSKSPSKSSYRGLSKRHKMQLNVIFQYLHGGIQLLGNESHWIGAQRFIINIYWSLRKVKKKVRINSAIQMNVPANNKKFPWQLFTQIKFISLYKVRWCKASNWKSWRREWVRERETTRKLSSSMRSITIMSSL